MYGAFIFFQISYYHFMLENHLCLFISLTPSFRLPNLFERSATSKFLMSDLASGEFLSKEAGKVTLPLRMFLYIPIGSSSLKGSMPKCISQIKMPRVHQSAALPWPWLRMTSGAIYSGVPQMVKVLPSFSILAKPKSASLRQPSLLKSKFSGLRSRQMMFLLCRYSKHRMTMAVQNLHCSVGKQSIDLRQEQSSPPLTSSCTRQRQRESWQMPQNEAMKGWFSWECTQFQLQTWSI